MSVREEGSSGEGMGGDRRCPSCGALVAEDADWCGQCWTSLAPVAEPVARAEPAPANAGEGRPGANPSAEEPSATRAPTALATPGGGRVEVAEGTATWECPVCGDRNPMDASLCETCQTPFARLFEAPGRREEIDPKAATGWSLLFPGLGHWKAGARADAVARFVLGAWTLGTVLIMLVSRPDGGFGTSFPLFVLYAGSAVGLYAESVVDARRVASDLDPLVSSRTLMWFAAGLVLGSIVLATFVTLPATRR